jgi:hypothetical protein
LRAGYENTECHSFFPYTIADPSGKVLSVFHIAAVSEQLPSPAYLLTIYHRSPESAWFAERQHAFNLAHITLQSLGNQRMGSGSAEKAKKVNACYLSLQHWQPWYASRHNIASRRKLLAVIK